MVGIICIVLTCAILIFDKNRIHVLSKPIIIIFARYFYGMKKIFFLLLIISFTKLSAQIHEVGVFLGGSNFIGDVGRTTYIQPDEFAYGILYKWNRSPRHSWRFSYTQAKLTANDVRSAEKGRQQRGYNFENNLKEISAGLEFNFFDFNLHDFTAKITPYIYTGITATNYSELYIVNGSYKIDSDRYTMAIPMTVGIKTNFTESLILGLEVGARYTFTDNLDGSNPRNQKLSAFKFGNLQSNDWYVFSGLTLTYTFGEKPCYCSN